MVFVVLPAFNEQPSIVAVLRELEAAMRHAALDYRVILVNDGSTDRTEALVLGLAGELPLVYLKHAANAGLGRAVGTGFSKALELGAPGDVVVTMDADHTHAPGLIPQLAELARRGRDVVIASRYHPGADLPGVPFLRRLLSRGAALLFRVFYPISGVRDYTSGYRAYRWEALRRASSVYGPGFIASAGFSCMVEILLKLRPLDITAAECPILLRYDAKRSASKMKVASNIRDTLALLWKARRWSGRGAAPGVSKPQSRAS